MKHTGSTNAIIILFTILLISCSGSNKVSQQNLTTPVNTEIVGEVRGEQITYSELKENFRSGSINEEYTLGDLQEFLPTYLDYRAKVKNAELAGYFENKRIVDEYETYSKQAAYAYWLKNTIRPTLFNEYKTKYELELKSSHILIALDLQASPSDTLEAFTKILEARSKFLEGASMSELDKEYSSQRNGISMGGDLPWFSVGIAVKEFEDILYNLEIGEISKPFRTQFGYHIILLEEKRAKKPARDVSHIFIRKNENASRLDSAIKKLEAGSLWHDIVKEYTEDTPSASNGGKIGWVSYGARYTKAFIDTVMNLNETLPFSKPIQSAYGYHIFKIDSVQAFESEKAKDAFLMKELENSRIFGKSNSFIASWLKEYYNGRVNNYNLSEFEDVFKTEDSTSVSEIELNLELSKKTIYTYDIQNYSAKDYLDYLVSVNKGSFTSNYSKTWFDDYTTSIVDAKLTEITMRDFPEFIPQTENYKNGLVIYQINEDSVWSAATVDTTKLQSMYNENPESYTFDTRYHYHLITSNSDTSLEKAINFVLEGNEPDSIRSSGIEVGVASDSTGAFHGEPFDILHEMELHTFSNAFDYNNRKAVFYLNSILPERPMTFDEAFNKLLVDYQPAREQKWLDRLRKDFSIKAYPEHLEKAFRAENQYK